MLTCTGKELEKLVQACMGHTNILTHPDIKVATCWDADRLDLPRCWIDVDPDRLATKQASDPRLISWAEKNAKDWLSKIQYRHKITLV